MCLIYSRDLRTQMYLFFQILSGNRTIAVCTKLDLMDPGTDALDILYGRGNLITIHLY